MQSNVSVYQLIEETQDLSKKNLSYKSIAKKLKDKFKLIDNVDNIRKFVSIVLKTGVKENKQIYKSFSDKENILTAKTKKSIRSLEEAIEYFEVDTEKWQVDRWVCNAWDMNGRDKDNTNYQVKIWLKAKSTSYLDVIKLLNDEIEPIKPLEELPTSKNGKLAVEIMITDLHLGKIGFDPETMQMNWTPQDALEAYNSCINETLRKIDLDSVELFILPFGNDFLNVDSSSNSTTRGTPQMAGDFWENLFVFGSRMLEQSILKLSQIAPVKCIAVQGNHDYHSVFSLGRVLEARFRDFNNVEVITSIKRKYLQFGVNGLGWFHGENIKHKDVFNAFSLDEPKMFADTKYRFIHTGHLHKNKMSKDVKDEQLGVEVEICPSLSPTDRWHYKNLYIGSYRRSKSFVYHKEKGKINEIYFNL